MATHENSELPFHELYLLQDFQTILERSAELSDTENRFWHLYSNFKLGHYEKVLEMSETYHDQLCKSEFSARYLMARGTTNWYLSKFDKFLHFNNLAYNDAIAKQEHNVIFGALSNIGSYFLTIGKLEDAKSKFLEVLDLASKYNLPKHESLIGVYLNLGGVHNSKGEYDSAINYYGKSIELAKELKLERKQATAEYNIARLYASQGKLVEAEKIYESVLQRRKMWKDKYRIIESIIGLGTIYLLRGDMQKCKTIYQEMISVTQDFNPPRLEYYVYVFLADILMKSCNYEEASKIGIKLKTYIEEKGSQVPDEIGYTYYILILSQIFSGNLSNAWEYYTGYQKVIELENEVSLNYANLLEGYLLKYSKRIHQKYASREYFQKVLDKEHLDNHLAIEASHSLLELLILEYEVFEEEEVIAEIHKIISSLKETARKNYNVFSLTSAILFEIKLDILEGNLSHANQLLNQSLSLIEENNLEHLTSKHYALADEYTSVKDQNQKASNSGVGFTTSLSRSFNLLLKQYPSDIDVILHPVKYKIMRSLFLENKLQRTDLRNTLDITNGSLSRHLQSLEEYGLIETSMEFADQKPQKIAYITNSGISVMNNLLYDLRI